MLSSVSVREVDSVLSEHVLCVSMSMGKPSVTKMSFSSSSGLDSNCQWKQTSKTASSLLTHIK